MGALLRDVDGPASDLAWFSPSQEELDEITTSEAAQRLSSTYCRSVLMGAAPPLSPMAMAEVVEKVRALERVRDASGVESIGHHRSKLLPSGIVLHYQEFGSESAPPVVLLHDLADERHSWELVGKLVGASFRVLVRTCTSAVPAAHHART
jgi:hypothetical protein